MSRSIRRQLDAIQKIRIEPPISLRLHEARNAPIRLHVRAAPTIATATCPPLQADRRPSTERRSSDVHLPPPILRPARPLHARALRHCRAPGNQLWCTANPIDQWIEQHRRARDALVSGPIAGPDTHTTARSAPAGSKRVRPKGIHTGLFAAYHDTGRAHCHDSLALSPGKVDTRATANTRMSA